MKGLKGENIKKNGGDHPSFQGIRTIVADHRRPPVEPPQDAEGADEGQRLGAGLGGRRGRMIHRHRGGIEGMFGQSRVARCVGQPSATFGLPCTAVALLYYIGVHARAIPLWGEGHRPPCPFSVRPTWA